MSSRPDFQDRGFSLLELIIVVVIILILAAISVPAINRAISTARVRGQLSSTPI
jgi:prepilin-type N-terminal cleavage/methylation domain-containing protein